MNKIKNIWKEALTSEQSHDDKITPLKILEEQANAINADVDKTNIVGMTMTFTISKDDSISDIKHILYIFPKNGNDYNYRFIEVKQRIDSIYPIEVQAFQDGDTNFGSCENENDFYETLRKIFMDIRTKVVFDQLRTIGKSIEDWKRERDE